MKNIFLSKPKIVVKPQRVVKDKVKKRPGGPKEDTYTPSSEYFASDYLVQPQNYVGV